MTRESKTIFLVGLVLTVYALMILTQSGGFVYPYPLNPAIFFVITLQISFWNRESKIAAILPSITGLFGMLSAPFLWESSLSLDQLQYLYQTPIIEWCKLLFSLSMIIWGGYTAFHQKKRFFQFVSLIGIISFIVFYFLSIYHWLILPYGIISASTFISPSKKNLDKLWVLLFILEMTFVITILFNR
ncbi:MAG: hypothetical protein MK066_11415 [Crocinitomicaceae bacterium]|nr:hypothetical protein [Crocinitomicaceae bacterium]